MECDINFMNKTYFNINENTKFIIYGAGLLGKDIYDKLIKNNFKVTAFLDRRAEKVNMQLKIKVFYPQSDSINIEEKENSVVIISLANVFEHHDIAKYLYSLGYKNILYKENVLNNLYSEHNNNLNNCYEKLLEGKTIINKKIPTFPTLYKHEINNRKSFLIKDDNLEIITYLPSELIFTEKKKNINVLDNKFSKYYDHSVYFSIPAISLFNTFEGKINYDLDNYIEFYKTSHSKFSHIDNDEAMRHINDRFKVYNYMSLALNINKGFFEKNPVKVEWNDKGYFNIIDGYHRTVFFLVKNLYKIPCKIKKSEYEKFINMKKLELCTNYMKRNKIVSTNSHITHPYFYFYKNKQQNIASRKLASICYYLAQQNIDIKKQTLLDVNSDISYYTQFFSRMGLNVVSIEKDIIKFNLAKLLNELFYCNSIKMINNDISEVNDLKQCDISLMISFTNKCIYTESGIEILKKVDKLTKKMMFWESSYNYKHEVKWILENTTFTNYINIEKFFGERGFSQLGVFIKGDMK
ncbi:hypothetical protein K8O91_12475 [Clostridium sporogenes]|nr:hypothetical protein [Clostridium sporogenes]MBA4507798.1 hypothetical protein [Clostridium sporogenes]UAL62055.1 hypothetical protein K8O91_12475 [Clostridium sporogenes]